MPTQLFTHPFIDNFPGDNSLNPMQRQTPNDLYARVETLGFPNASLLATNDDLLSKFGIKKPLDSHEINLLEGNAPTSLKTYSTAYAGHQFGNWAGQLGDGRAIYLGELSDLKGNPWEWQYKGAGTTPYSRRGDGRAVLRSTIREYLMSEAMHHLGIPTTRSISISLSGEDVMRDIMYDGNPQYEKGALMLRAAKSFLRFGHFELLTANNQKKLLQKLTDYVIDRYFFNIKSTGKQKYLDFFLQVQNDTIQMIIEWYRVGFVHGVMNTDNMSILGLTIDYGPFAMLDEYDLQFTSNTTDLPGRRYAFGQQANIALWNLNALANAIYPLIEESAPLQNILEKFELDFWKAFDNMMGRKMGLDRVQKTDTDLIKDWQILMLNLKIDYTLFFSELKNLHKDKAYKISLKQISYKELTEDDSIHFYKFIQRYLYRIEQNQMSKDESLKLMQKANPEFILRNYLLYDATQDAENGDYKKFFKLWKALQVPYDNKFPEFKTKRPEWANNVPGCSMLSCSS